MYGTHGSLAMGIKGIGMKKRLFGLKARDKRNLSRYKEDVIDLDEDYDEDYEDEDYPEDDYEDDYPEDDYPEDDYPEDEVEGERYEDDRYEDEDDYPEDDGEYYPEDEVEDERYEDDRYEEEDERYEDEEDYPEEDDYPEDDYPEDEIEGERYVDDRYEGEDDYPEDDYPEDDYEDDDYPEDEDDEEYYPGDAKYDDRRRHGKRDRRDRGESIPARILGFLANTSATERIAAIFAIMILAGGIATASFYVRAMGNRQQIDSFAEVGADLSEETIYGQSGLIAVADAEKARAMAAELVSDDAFIEEEEEEVPDDAENVTIKMTLTSIKSDMKVKFINSQTGKLVANLPLEIEVETPDGSKVTYNDHDQDGIIYKKDITAGVYKITPKALPSGYENYKLEIKTQSLTVKDQVEMKAVDVSNEVKKESQVNAAKEDTAVKTEVESQLQDTVEWVESTKVAVGESTDGTYSYEEVKRDTVPDPASGTMVGVRSWMFLGLTGSSTTSASIGDDETPKSNEPGEGNSKSEDNGGSGNSSEGGNTGGGETPAKKDQIKISVEKTTMTVDETQSVSSSGTSATVTYTSSNDGVVFVSGSTLTAKSAGTATITASADNCESDSVTITVKEKEKVNSKFSVDGNTISVKVGEKTSIGASASSTISYSSQDESIATVSSDGTVTGVKEGSTKITLKAADYDDGTVNVTVSKADDKDMSGYTATMTLKVGGSEKIKLGTPSAVTFKSENDKIATVASDGTVTAVAEGTTNIILSATGYKDAKVAVTVGKADDKTMKVESATALTVKVSEEVQLKVTDPKTVKYETDKKEVATVTEAGLIKGVSVGTANIKITAEGYTPVTVVVTVIAKEGTKVPMKVTKVTLVEGQSVKLASSEDKLAIKLATSNANVAAVSDTTVTGKSVGEATITVSATGYADNTITVSVISKGKTLKDKSGNVLYVKNDDGSYREAVYEDYYKGTKLYLRKAATNFKYTGWQTIDGKTYFFTKDGNYVTGEQVIQGAKYSFGSDGVLAISAGGRGIDVSKWNGNIDWAAVKNSGINFVIIRCGYRGSSEGQLIEDPTFRRNIQGAQNAGIRVGIYFFTQAVNEVEAVEEASMVINLIKGYNISYPVYLDVEASHGRGDGIDPAQRTANIKAFCGTIQNAGYKAGVYANKTWFTSYINTSQITNYKIWLAQYAEAVTYSGSRYDMWQYTSKGRVTGINGFVDMNICY